MTQLTRRSMATRLTGVALLALMGSARAGQDETRAWIQRMNHAVVNRNYDGAFTQLFGNQTQVFRIVHRMQDGVMVERIISADGSGYEQKRQGARWAEFRPRDKLVVVAERNRSFGHFPALNGIDRNTYNFYDMRTVGPTRLLGRDVQVVQIEPKDNLRFGFRLWLDRESALPLKIQRTTLDGKVLKEIAFISPPALRETISDEELKVAIDTRGFRIFSTEKSTPMHNPELPRAYRLAPELLPAGYRSRIFNSPEEEQRAVGPRSRFIVSDGVSWGEVFISPLSGPAAGKDSTSSASGPLAIHRLRLSDVQVVVMGEMPQATARAIAEAVRPE
jgi:sigma-E factor negative regulatory protein RseB